MRLAARLRALAAQRSVLVALALLTLLVLAALLAPWLAPHAPQQQYRADLLRPPAWLPGGDARFWLGTDDAGRDLFSRLLHGARVSLGIGAAAVALSIVPGVLLGLVAAFFQRSLAPVILRAMDVMMALPGLLLALLVITVLGPGLTNTVLAIAIGALPGFVRLSRAAALNELAREYVQAARSMGASTTHLMFKSVLPNCTAPLIVNASLAFSSAILEAAGLGFLGLGVQPPTPEWGAMLASARDHLVTAPWLVAAPGLAILLTVLCVNVVGDGLRDALDPRLRQDV